MKPSHRHPEGEPWHAALARRSVELVMRRSLARAFRYVGWVGPPPTLDPERPVVFHANHHSFYDGYLLWLVARAWLGRPVALWMEEYDRFPFFGWAGAMPFPADDARRRAATLRATGRFLREVPQGALLLFPEGVLHAPEDGVLSFPDGVERLAAALPPAQACPVAIHLTWRGHDRPVALLRAGTVDAAGTVSRAALVDAWDALRAHAGPPDRILLGGRRSVDERVARISIRERVRA